MDTNNFFNFNSCQTQDCYENNASNSMNSKIPLYPETEISSKKNINDENTQNQQQNANLNNFLQLLSLFNSKKMDISTLLSSPIGKKLGVNENLASILSLLNNKNQTKIQTNSQKETLPKIDSLERLK